MTTRGRHRTLRARKLTEDLPNRVRELAEAGAKGRVLSPIEVKEVCEALHAQGTTPPTRFSSFS